MKINIGIAYLLTVVAICSVISLLAGCSNYDTCFDRNFKAYYEGAYVESEAQRKWQANQYAAIECRNIN